MQCRIESQTSFGTRWSSTFQGLISARKCTRADSQSWWNSAGFAPAKELSCVFTKSSGVRSQRGQKHDGVAMLMTSSHSRMSLAVPGKSRGHSSVSFLTSLARTTLEFPYFANILNETVYNWLLQEFISLNYIRIRELLATEISKVYLKRNISLVKLNEEMQFSISNI